MSVFIIGCRKDKHITIPSVSTGPMVNITIITAEAQGNLLSNGGSEEITCGFCLNTTGNPTTADRSTIESVNPVSGFVSYITDLKGGTKYFLRAYGTNQAGTGYGNEISFTTKDAEVPIVHSGEITNISKNSAVCEGILQFDGGEKILSQGICYSQAPDPAINDITVEASGYRFSARISELLSNTTYYVRAYATNSVGTGYGLSKPFKTKAFFKISSIVSDISINSAKCTSSLVTDGEKPVSEWGICWATSPEPNINDNRVPAPSVNSVLVVELINLSEETTYYIRPYVLAGTGPEYGDVFLFNTKRQGATMTDIEGNSYNTVSIGKQVWMAENLRVNKFRDGSAVTESWAYNNDNANVAAYGRLYTYNVASSGSICPAGWHVPSNTEWSILGSYLIMNGYNYDGSIPSADPFSDPATYNNNKIGKSLTSATGWNTSNITGAAGSEDFSEKRNLSGFNAQPGGMYFTDGRFYFLGSIGIWWSNDFIRYICGTGMHGVPIECFKSSWFITYDKVPFESGTPYFGQKTAYSIRCIKD